MLLLISEGVTTETRGCKDCWANPPSLHRGKDGDSLEIKRDKPRKRGEQGTKGKGPLVEEQSHAIIEKESSFCPELYFSAPGYHLSATLWLSSVLGTDTLLTEGGGWREGDTEQLVVLSGCPQLSGYSSTCFLFFLTCGALRLCRHICKPAWASQTEVQCRGWTGSEISYNIGVPRCTC